MSAGGLVLHSVAGGRNDGGGWDRWSGQVPMLVRTGDGPLSYAAPDAEMTRAKYPIAGTTLPLTIDAADPSKVAIDWDRVPQIDEWIANRHPVFTDPDTVHSALVQAMSAHLTTITDAIDEQVGGELGPGAPFDHDSAPRALQVMRAAARAEEDAALGTFEAPPIPPDHARATILAVSRSSGTPFSYHGEVLLSVVVPGAPRYGVRWTGMVGGIGPRQILHGGLRKLDEWTDLPVTVSERDPSKLDIDWGFAPNVLEVTAAQLHAIGDRLQARIDDPSSWAKSMEPMLSAIPDPQRQAEVRLQIAEAMARPGPWGVQLGAVAAPQAAPATTPAGGGGEGETADGGTAADPVDELARLAQQLAAGAITQQEFEAAKAQLLQQI
jgi:hypothetical protein